MGKIFNEPSFVMLLMLLMYLWNCIFVVLCLSLFVAEIGRIILIGVISTLGIIVFILILLAVAYFWWRHKRSQLEFVEPCDENETSSGSLKFQQMLDTQQQEQMALQQQQQQLQQQQQNAAANPTTNNINRKINGFLNLKTPLIGWVLFEIRHLSFSQIREKRKKEKRGRKWTA